MDNTLVIGEDNMNLVRCIKTILTRKERVQMRTLGAAVLMLFLTAPICPMAEIIEEMWEKAVEENEELEEMPGPYIPEGGIYLGNRA